MGNPTSTEYPRVSVVLTTCDRKDLLSRALRSVVRQSHPVDEIIVVDDGSRDGTIEELAPAFPSVSWLRQENKGVSSARNLGIRRAGGDWIALLDSDDEWEESKLKLQLETILQKPEALASHTGERWIRSGNEVMPPTYLDKSALGLFDRSLLHCLICPSSVLLSREIFSAIGYFDESLPVCEDYDFWLRLLLFTEPILVSEKLVLKHGGHKDQLSTAIWGMDRFRIQAMEKLLENPMLPPEKAREVRAVIVQKCSILSKGFSKRGKLEDSRRYDRKKDQYDSLLGETPAFAP